MWLCDFDCCVYMDDGVVVYCEICCCDACVDEGDLLSLREGMVVCRWIMAEWR